MAVSNIETKRGSMRYLKLLFALLLFMACNGRNEVIQVTIYPTYGYDGGDHWSIPMRIWVHTPQERAEKLLTNGSWRILGDWMSQKIAE